MDNISKQIKVPFISKLAYGMGDVGCNFSWMFVGNFLMIFYTDVFGISMIHKFQIPINDERCFNFEISSCGTITTTVPLFCQHLTVENYLYLIFCVNQHDSIPLSRSLD